MLISKRDVFVIFTSPIASCSGGGGCWREGLALLLARRLLLLPLRLSNSVDVLFAPHCR